jgi:ligand-binding SRPBCC domain-containing protein
LTDKDGNGSASTGGPFADRFPAISRRPGGYVLTSRTVLRRSQADVFAFLADANNLNLITPGWLRFRILTPMPVEMRKGAIFDYELRLHGLPVRWRTEITEWSPTDEFADTQRRGPYRQWRHLHTLHVVDSHTTAVEDEVLYRVLGGALAHRLLVRRDLLRLYRHEQRRMHELLEG